MAEANRIDAINRANMRRTVGLPGPSRPGVAQTPFPYVGQPHVPQAQPYRPPIPGRVPR